MQTIIGFSYKAPRPVAQILAGLERVKDYYSSLSQIGLELKGWVSPTNGLAALVPSKAPSNWPMWWEDGDLTIATLYAPLGWRRIIDQRSMEIAPRALLEALQRRPQLVAELSPPFALFSLDKSASSLQVVNDGLGYARVYRHDSADASVIASRVEAASIFLGEAPALDMTGWQSLAGSGWFMGDTTPLAKVTHLRPGSTITWSNDHPSGKARYFDSLGQWTGHRFQSLDEAGAAVADDLLNFADEVSNLWNDRPTLHLSGGRDSRAAAAGFVSAGIPAKFHTVASLKGELDVAATLLETVGREADHSIVEERDTSATGDIVARTVRLQQGYGGIYGPAGVKQGKFSGFTKTLPVVTGAAGEIARGNFYKGAVLDRIRKRGRKGAFERLSSLYAFHGCVRPEVRERVDEYIEKVLGEARRNGLDDVSVLDYFYLSERLRRWSNASSKLGTLTPLASPAYIRGAFSQNPEQKLAEQFHLDIIARLVPAWRSVPFYKAKPEDTAKRTRPWLWNSGDKARAEEVIRSPDRWEDLFVPADVKQVWTEALAGAGAGRHEIIIQRVIWKHAFEDTLFLIGEACRAKVEPRYYVAEPGDEHDFQPIMPR